MKHHALLGPAIANSAGDFHAIHRHAYVEDDEVERLSRCLEYLHRLLQIRRLEDPIPFDAQQPKHEAADDFLVVNHQELLGAECDHSAVL
jgi:hypothetical protein